MLRIVFIIYAFVLILIAAYIISLLSTVTAVLWKHFSGIGVEKIDLGVDYKTQIFIPAISALATFLVVATVLWIGKSIKARRG